MIKIGGYLLFYIEFPNRKMRDRFEKQEKVRRMFQYSDRINEEGIGPRGWYDCTYYPVWMGYGEPQDILKRCRKNKIKIVKFLSIDLSTQSGWWDVIKEELFEEEE